MGRPSAYRSHKFCRDAWRPLPRRHRHAAAPARPMRVLRRLPSFAERKGLLSGAVAQTGKREYTMKQCGGVCGACQNGGCGGKRRQFSGGSAAAACALYKRHVVAEDTVVVIRYCLGWGVSAPPLLTSTRGWLARGRRRCRAAGWLGGTGEPWLACTPAGAMPEPGPLRQAANGCCCWMGCGWTVVISMLSSPKRTRRPHGPFGPRCPGILGGPSGPSGLHLGRLLLLILIQGQDLQGSTTCGRSLRSRSLTPEPGLYCWQQAREEPCSVQQPHALAPQTHIRRHTHTQEARHSTQAHLFVLHKVAGRHGLGLLVSLQVQRQAAGSEGGQGDVGTRRGAQAAGRGRLSELAASRGCEVGCNA